MFDDLQPGAFEDRGESGGAGGLGAAHRSARERLTARELDVLSFIVTGDSNAEIADGLGISVHTVERHASSLYRKIGVRCRAQAAAFAVTRLGLPRQRPERGSRQAAC